ncbi:hypothetical protein [Halobacillus litoralis]|uniref:Thiopeptide-type bacteriocin biosynthesis domain-containing protein n=1 Tax=Halobacillus litoralis TaxID=45668 RepID=A0A410MC22_9BACI|nr:hypothetical protein [Halobacillus litoralis]QAS52240.1 hypothetical protein HLI_08350 [Halobacillus litoralis]
MKGLLIFNYNAEEDARLVHKLTTILACVDRYFLSRSWEGGPHLKITFDEDTKASVIRRAKDDINQVMNEILINEELERQLIQKYERNASTLAKLENKEEASAIEEHGTIKMVDHHFFYHNREITDLFNEMRFEARALLTDLYMYIHKHNIKLSHAFPVLFHYVSEVYKEDGKNKGYFSFISHVHGFFELSKKQGLSYSEAEFEKHYQAERSSMVLFAEKHSGFINQWSTYWKKSFHKLKINIDDVIDENYLEEMEESFSSLKEFTNDFHHRFSDYASKQGFIYDPSATAYRFLINSLYMCLPFLRVSALKKQQFIYMAYRYTEELNDVTWREQIGIR